MQKICIALFVVLFVGSVEAQPLRSLFGLGVNAGAGYGVNEAIDRPLAGTGRIFLLWQNAFGSHISPDLGAGFIQISSGQTGRWADYTTSINFYDLRLRFNPINSEEWAPYIYGGIGTASYQVLEVPPNAAPDAKLTGSAIFFPIGVGFSHKVGSHLAVSLTAGGNLAMTDDLNPVHDNVHDGWYTGMLGVTYTFDDGPTDSDHDGITDEEELRLGTDPNNADTDGDGISDYDELYKYKTNPLNPDTDGDGLKDGEEILKYRTDPLKKDTDGDGLSDGDEIFRYHTNPLVADTDSDGLSDGDEVLKYHTDPLKQDTDGDNLTDGEEVLRYKTDPLAADTDGDGLTDGEEVKMYHTDPHKMDTDGGGISDGVEVRRGTNPLDAVDDMPVKHAGLDLNIGRSIVLEGVVFETNKAIIKPESEPVLQKVLTTFRDNPTLRVEIRGHTDNTGLRTKNVALSLERAQAVRAWFIAHGVDQSRMTTKGLGPDQPITPNDSPANKQKNRRIEFARTS
jgi:outer membrane protein OmpA-like peptidoglycan-associated protein